MQLLNYLEQIFFFSPQLATSSAATVSEYNPIPAKTVPARIPFAKLLFKFQFLSFLNLIITILTKKIILRKLQNCYKIYFIESVFQFRYRMEMMALNNLRWLYFYCGCICWIIFYCIYL